MSEGLVEMFKYNSWANQALFEACRSLSDDQLDFQGSGISGSVRELLMHIAGGQETLILRTQGRQNEGELARWSEWPGFDALVDLVSRTSRELTSIAEGIEDGEQVDLPFQGASYRYPKRFFLAHAIQHGIEHRTEVKAALAQAGVQTPDLDCWYYSEAAGYGKNVPDEVNNN